MQIVVQQGIDLKQIFDAISVDRKFGNGQDLTYHEYVAAVMFNRVVVTENRLGLVFTYLDPDNVGYITSQILRNALGEEIPEFELRNMIASADSDNDGVVTKRYVEYFITSF